MKNTETQTHTPGPWKADIWEYPGANPPRRELNIQNSEFLIARLAWDEGKENPFAISDAEAQANARLIAAGPELLEALQGLFRECAMIHKYGGEVDNTKQADAAILAAQNAINKATI